MNTMRALGLTTAVAAALLIPTVAATPAFAQDGGGTAVKAAGACTDGGSWKLKAGPDDGRLEVEFEVDTNVVGQVWKVRVVDGPTVVFAGRRTTVAPSGSFSVESRTTDRAGRDTITATATRGGNTCTGTVRI